MRTLYCLVLLLGMLPGLRAAESLEQAFQSALMAEEARRDMDAAIRGYEGVIAQVDGQRAIAATAVFRLGECYRKVGRTNDAVAQYQRLLRDFPGEATLTRLSRENLLVLGAVPKEVGSTNALVTIPGLPADEEQQEIQRLRTLFDRSPDLMDAPSDGLTPLSRAAAKGQLSVVKALIGWGADVNKAVGGETALHSAAGAGHKAVVEALLDAKADPNAVSPRGGTPLSVAVFHGYTAVVETLLERGAKPQSDPGHSALFAAVETGRTNLIERLVKAGEDVNVTLSAGTSGAPRQTRTLLEAALKARQRGASQMLIRLGAVVMGENDVMHPLDYALFGSGHLPEVDWFRELLAAAPKEGLPKGLLDRLLYQAVNNGGREYFIPLLIEAGAQVDSRGWNNTDTPLVVLAAAKASVRALELVLAAKPDPNATNRSGATALHVATERGLTNFIAALLRAGADPNRLDGEDRTPLSIAQRSLASFRTRGTESATSPNLVHEAGNVVVDVGGPGVGTVPTPETILLSPPSTVPPRFANDADRRIYEQWLAAESLLLAAGARADVVQRLGIHWQRGEASGQLLRRAGDDPAPSLADALVLAFGQRWTQWADLGAIRVFRLTEDGTAMRVLPVPKDWYQRDGCDWSFPLEWGDAVEIPEVDRVANAKWPGLPDAAWVALRRCSARRVSLTIKEEALDLELWPDGNGRAMNTAPAEPGEPMRIGTCKLGSVVQFSGRLRSSSDRSRVRVSRKASGQTWTLDVEKDPRAQRFWLIDGDRIEVPEKAQ